MTASSRSIGELGRRTRCKVRTIRWHEEIGPLPVPARTEGGHRVYGWAHLERFEFIRHAREFGFTLDAVWALIALSDHPERPCEKVHALARGQLAAVEDKLRRLETLRAKLARMTGASRGGAAGDCHILETRGRPQPRPLCQPRSFSPGHNRRPHRVMVSLLPAT